MSSGGHIVPVWPFTRADPLKPPPQFADLRVACPISEVELWDGSRSLLATRYDDIKQLLRDPRLSSDTARAGFPQSSATLAAARAGRREAGRERRVGGRRERIVSERIVKDAPQRPRVGRRIDA